MPLSKKRMRERKRLDRQTQVKPNTVEHVKPKEALSAKLRAAGLVVEGNTIGLGLNTPDVKPNAVGIRVRIPLYNRNVHKQGDIVRMPGGQVVTVPELDMDGYPVTEG